MTFIEVGIPSGYVVTRDAIEKLYVSGIPGLRRAHFADQMLIIYLETVRKTGRVKYIAES